MRYAQFLDFDVVNGIGIGVSLFVQGCDIHCEGCFNSELWDFNEGHEWTTTIKEQFFTLVDRPYIKRISILGGEPLSEANLQDILQLTTELKDKFPDKQIWIYSGYKWDVIFPRIHTDDFDAKRVLRQEILKKCDVMVDGEFIESQKDPSLQFRGSKNQRIIDLKKSIEYDSIIYWQDN